MARTEKSSRRLRPKAGRVPADAPVGREVESLGRSARMEAPDRRRRGRRRKRWRNLVDLEEP
ncbi:MAG TPA: hypothetical protein VF121_16190 [Thermoanaerobaculia bacterium]|nr:hypothetical protein [Thermoanaerobaculia bacterium]